MKGILYTTSKGGVEICYPADECIKAMAEGIWREKPHGFFEVQIERQIEAGHFSWAAQKFVLALGLGGIGEKEAFEIIKDRDCGHLGFAHEIVDSVDLPDRWFRDAWKRSKNGGPIDLDLNKAKEIQFTKISTRLEALNRKNLHLLNGVEVYLDLSPIRSRIKKAGDVDELKSIWPESLGRPA